MMRNLITNLLLLLFISGVASAESDSESFYLQLVKGSEIDPRALDDATKQIKEHKEVELIEDIAVAPFHKRIDEAESKKRPICRSCHQKLPHTKSERSRAFLNMHSRFIACESCHLQKEGVIFDYRWVAYSQPWMGEVIDATASVHTQADEKVESIVPRPGARIAPFYRDEAVYTFSDHSYVSEIERVWNEGSLEERARLKAKLHQPLNSEGRKCKSCHRDKDGILDLQQLGANEKQQRAITHNVISQFFERYKEDDERLRLTDLLR